MTPAEFLQHVWPSEGFYAIAWPFKVAGGDARYAHRVFSSVDAAAAFVNEHRFTRDMFFCVHSLREEKVWNATKTDHKTGERGAWEIRTHKNMLMSKALFLDLDVGDDDDRKYPSQAAAITSLRAFCNQTQLPKPMLVSSGRGVHVYWVLDKSIPSAEWKSMATMLKRLVNHYGMLADPARTTDTASVLRVAGTRHLKDPANPRKVKVLMSAEVIPLDRMQHKLRYATISAGLDVTLSAPPSDNDLGSNTQRTYEGTPPTVKALGKVCGQLKHYVRNIATASEPAWYAMLQLVRFAEDGEKWCHKLSAGHPDYDPATTQNKIEQLKSKDVGPTTCAAFSDKGQPGICDMCAFRDKVKSPIVAARAHDNAPAPAVPDPVQPQIQIEIPEPPAPFRRLKSGEIVRDFTNPEGDDVVVQIYDYDMYPMRRITDEIAQTDQTVWRVHLPHVPPKDFVMEASKLYRLDTMAIALANNGVYVTPSRLKDVQEYMSAYIQKLQRVNRADESQSVLGWRDDHRSFVLPDLTLSRDGTTAKTYLTRGAEASSHAIGKAGTLERQVDLMRFYAYPGYVASQVMILASLGAPLLHMTGHAGLVINATGDAGASKSTSLYAAASLWAHPKKFPLNGTAHGATQKARAQRMTTLGSLPVCVDEITTMQPRDAQELVMNVTQPGGRTILGRDSVEKLRPDAEKSTIMLCTANNSLHSLLAVDNAAGNAGSMRVLEMRMMAQSIHSKAQADTFIFDMLHNYGHIGEAYITAVVKRYDEIVARVQAKVREIDQSADIAQAERFWSAGIAVVVVAGEISNELGLTFFDTKHLQSWLIHQQIGRQRAIVKSQYVGSTAVLADFMASIAGQTLLTRKSGDQVYVLQKHQGALHCEIREDIKVAYVSRNAFRDWCARRGGDANRVIEELSSDGGLITDAAAKRVLGFGTEFGTMRSNVFVINLKHVDAAGAMPVTVVGQTTSTAPASKGKTA